MTAGSPKPRHYGQSPVCMASITIFMRPLAGSPCNICLIFRMTKSADGGRDRALDGPHDCRGKFEYCTNVALPCRHLDEPVPQHQLFESMILIVDLLLDHVDSVLQVAKNATH